MKIRLVVLLAFILLIFNGCDESVTDDCLNPKYNGCDCAKNNNTNFIILSSLDDRVCKSDGSNTDIEDKKIIRFFKEQYFNLIKNQAKIKQTKSFFDFRIAPQDDLDTKLNDFENSLSVNLQSFKRQPNVQFFKPWNESFNNNLDAFYSIATLKEKKSEYKGARVTSYIDDMLLSDLEKASSCSKNILVILTDGYFDYEADQIGLLNKDVNSSRTSTSTSIFKKLRGKSGYEEIFKKEKLGVYPPKKSFNELYVIVYGLKTKNPSQNESGILKLIWDDYLDEMGINKENRLILNPNISTSSATNLISKFLESKTGSQSTSFSNTTNEDARYMIPNNLNLQSYNFSKDQLNNQGDEIYNTYFNILKGKNFPQLESLNIVLNDNKFKQECIKKPIIVLSDKKVNKEKIKELSSIKDLKFQVYPSLESNNQLVFCLSQVSYN